MILGGKLRGVNFAVFSGQQRPAASTRLRERCVDRSASRARNALYVAIKPRDSTSRPVGRLIVINPRPGSQEAEEDVPRGPDDNSRVPGPHDHIAGLRVPDTAKTFDSVIEIVGTGVGVAETGALVNCMHEMRAVMAAVAPHLGIEGGSDHG